MNILTPRGHYHQERPRQGMGNKIVEPECGNQVPVGRVQCRKRLGGVLNYYYREAA